MNHTTIRPSFSCSTLNYFTTVNTENIRIIILCITTKLYSVFTGQRNTVYLCVATFHSFVRPQTHNHFCFHREAADFCFLNVEYDMSTDKSFNKKDTEN